MTRVWVDEDERYPVITVITVDGERGLFQADLSDDLIERSKRVMEQFEAMQEELFAATAAAETAWRAARAKPLPPNHTRDWDNKVEIVDGVERKLA